MTTTNADTTLHLKRSFNAPRERVFEAWTNPDHLRKWHHPDEDYETSIVEVDLREGGAYRIGMRHIEKDILHVACGEYREISSPERLVFTWSWEEREMDPTLVTIRFHDKGDQTEVELLHERFADAETRDHHETGWTGCTGSLAAYLEG
jgi:uncharacterized protein YndB with AHSA1/START domain